MSHTGLFANRDKKFMPSYLIITLPNFFDRSISICFRCRCVNIKVDCWPASACFQIGLVLQQQAFYFAQL